MVQQPRSKRTLLAATAMAAIVLLGLATPSPAKDIVIGVTVGLSGANSVVAPSVVQSAQLAADEINAKGGVLGRKIEIAVLDDGSGPDGALKAFNAAIYQKKVDVIIAMETSAARNAGAPIAMKAKIPFIYTSFYEGRACGKYLIVNAEVPEQMAAPLVKFMTEEFKAKKWFAVGSDYAFGRGMLDAAKKLIQQSGGTIVGDEYNPMDASDWTAILSKVRAAKPDVIIYATAGGAPNVTWLKQYRAAGFKMPVGSLSLDEGTAKQIGQAAEGVYYTSSYFTGLPNPENKTFLAAMKKKFGADMKTPNALSVPEYDGVYAYVLAVGKVKTTEAEAIMKALTEVTFKGPRGPIRMNRSRHAALPIYLGQVQPDGSTKVVKDYGLIDPGEQCPGY